MENPIIEVGTRLYRPKGTETEIVTVVAVVREPEASVLCGQYIIRFDNGEESEMSQPAALSYLHRFGSPLPVEIKVEVGTRFYMPQGGSAFAADSIDDCHAATIVEVNGYHKWTHNYECDCGFLGNVHEADVHQWLREYGTPPPKPNPLPRLDYTEESLISDLANLPLGEECAMHGAGCDFTEFDCVLPDASDVMGVCFEFVQKARELVKRRKD